MSEADIPGAAAPPPPRRARVAVLISGRGSNMSALLAAARRPEYPADIVLVLANKPESGGLAVAAAAGIATATVSHRDHPDREAFDGAIDRELKRHDVDIVCLAGFMRILTPGFVESWQGRMINIHPSLLPAYRGLDTHARAIAAGDREAGCTVHYVVPELDAGPIIAQARVPVLATDTPEALADRVLVEEHRLYPEALAEVARSIARRG